MLGSDVLEVAIGVVFLFLLLAVIVSTVTEFISQLFAMRSRMLHGALATTLFDEDTRDELYAHPLIKALSKKGPLADRLKRPALPSYLPSDLVAKAILSNVSLREEGGTVRITATGALATNPELMKVIASAGNKFAPAAERAASLEHDLAAWFDASMDRVSGWYKRRAKSIVLAVTILIVIGANADVFRFAQALSVNPSARDAIVAAAGQVTTPASPAPGAAASPVAALPTAQQARAALATLDYGIGWDGSLSDKADPRHPPAGIGDVVDASFLGAHVPGWFFSIIAVSLGAPFWFNLLGELLALRSTGTKPAKATPADAS